MTSTSALTASPVATPAAETVNWEVIWGEGEQDRVRYIDYGDGLLVSQAAEAMATRTFLEMVTANVRCGIYRNGECISRNDVL